MNRYKLSKVGINTKEGIERFNGDADSYEKYLYLFPQDENFGLMCKAIDEKDVWAAFTAAHALKGVAGNLSLDKLYIDIKPLVEKLRAGSLDDTKPLLDTVENDYDEIIDVLR